VITRTVTEWGYIRVEEDAVGAFSRRVADEILEIARNSTLAGSHGESVLVDHRHRLRAQQVVGIVASARSALEILPKIEGASDETEPRKRLIQMLSVVYDLEIDPGSITDTAWQNQSVLEIIIRLFVDRLERAVHQGLPRSYILTSDDLPRLRGKLNVTRQFGLRAARPQLLACQFDELSADVPLNQIMKAAVGVLSHLSKFSETQRRLAELRFAFADVSAVDVRGLPWDQVVLNRSNRNWTSLIALAKLLLRGRYQLTSLGGTTGFSLLFEMNTLFEEYVGRMLQRALTASPLQVRLQGPTSHCLTDQESAQRAFATRPDITVCDADRIAFVVDTKWKSLGRAGERLEIAQADIYQMMAYAHVYRCSNLILVYPHGRNIGCEPGLLRRFRVNGTETCELAIATIALGSPGQVVEALRSLIFGILNTIEGGIADSPTGGTTFMAN
jgi:5-methylcytosine-specific restriction enzyme subunit McrC